VKTITGFECLYATKSDEQMDKKNPEDKEKQKEKRRNEIVLTISLMIVVGILMYVFMTSLKPQPLPNDSNSTDTNSTDEEQLLLASIKDEKWCHNQFMHRRPILYINITDTDTNETKHLKLQEARDQNYVADGVVLFMENLGKNGLLCGNFLYFDFRNIYNVCLKVPDINRLDCFDANIEGLGYWVRLYSDLNSSDTNR